MKTTVTQTTTPIHKNSVMAKALLRKELTQLKNLAPDWDDDDGQPPAAIDIKNASDFLDYIPGAGLATLELMVAGDGDVGYEWKTKKLRLEVGFRRGPNFLFCGRRANRRRN